MVFWPGARSWPKDSACTTVKVLPGFALKASNVCVESWWLRKLNREIGNWVGSGGAWAVLAQLIQMVADGTFRVAIDQRLPLRDAAGAHRYLDQRKNIGKVVLQP